MICQIPHCSISISLARAQTTLCRPLAQNDKIAIWTARSIGSTLPTRPPYKPHTLKLIIFKLLQYQIQRHSYRRQGRRGIFEPKDACMHGHKYARPHIQNVSDISHVMTDASFAPFPSMQHCVISCQNGKPRGKLEHYPYTARGLLVGALSLILRLWELHGTSCQQVILQSHTRTMNGDGPKYSILGISFDLQLHCPSGKAFSSDLSVPGQTLQLEASGKKCFVMTQACVQRFAAS
jgi:hypothetical protein